MAEIHFKVSMEEIQGLFMGGQESNLAKLLERLLNQTLRMESAEVIGATSYERTEGRKDYRNGTRERTLNTRIGSLTLSVPRHRYQAFHSTMFENYQRNEQALLTTMLEMVVQGVATRKIEKITEELCGIKFSKSNVSALCKRMDVEIERFKNRPLTGSYPFVMLDAMYVDVREDYRVRSKAFQVALGINDDGRKEVLGFDVCELENEYNWERFIRGLRKRGLTDVDLMVSDSHAGLVSAIKRIFPESSWQRCQVHFSRNITDACPRRYQAGLAQELRALFTAPTLEEARELKRRVQEEYESVAPRAMNTLDEGFDDAMSVMCLPLKYRKSLRSTNLLERENQELRRRERVIRIFPNADSVIRLLGAVLLDRHEGWSVRQRVFNMTEYLASRTEIQNKWRAA